ncbi:MAG: hypothetical protein RBU30_26360 [Polyangia bacterium]|nr:hypothetical protein [Polyangia bacterium]
MSKEPRNLLIPRRRDQKNDFASGTGEELERSKVTQVLATEGATPRSAGELPWRTNFGSALHLLRHQRNDEALGELTQTYCKDALKRWLPNHPIGSGDRAAWRIFLMSEGDSHEHDDPNG